MNRANTHAPFTGIMPTNFMQGIEEALSSVDWCATAATWLPAPDCLASDVANADPESAIALVSRAVGENGYRLSPLEAALLEHLRGVLENQVQDHADIAALQAACLRAECAAMGDSLSAAG